MKTRSETFIDFLVAAMTDAAVERKMTQLKTTITPEKTGKATFVRVIIVPESMDVEWTKPLGSEEKH